MEDSKLTKMSLYVFGDDSGHILEDNAFWSLNNDLQSTSPSSLGTRFYY